MSDDRNFMHQDGVEVGYMDKRKAQFNDAIAKGIGGNKKTRSAAKPKRATKPKDDAPKRTSKKSATPKPVDEEPVVQKKSNAKKGKSDAFGGGPKDLSKLPPGLRKFWQNKRKGK